jgi:putative hydrolase of the HAD superfamily
MALLNSYDGLIFDYGGVLVHDQTDEDRARLAAIARVPDGLFTDLYWANRIDYDKDLVTAAEYWRAVAAAGGSSIDQQAIEELIYLDTTSWMQFDSVMWEWIEQLRAAGKRVAMLSNMPRDLGDALKTRTHRLANFDFVTLSYELRAAKPEPVVYEHCLGGLGLPPEKVLFFDDKIANVRGAELLGIRGVQFTGRDEVLARLRVTEPRQ